MGILPLGILVFFVLLAVVLDLWAGRWWAKTASYAGIGAALVGELLLWGKRGNYMEGLLSQDSIGIVAGVLVLLFAFLALLITDGYDLKINIREGEIYILLALSSAGALVMVTTRHLLVGFLGMEIMSVANYALAGLKRDRLSKEASVKYAVLGVVASVFFVLGMAFYYGAGGSFLLDARVAANPSPIAMAAGFLLLSSLMFKVSLFPFHFWTPDVYQGSPAPVTAFFSVITKTAGFVFLLRLSDFVIHPEVKWFILGASVLSMVYGNLVALKQQDIKRLMAYSSISHAGYMAMGLALGKQGAWVILFYLAAYGFMNLGAFAVISSLLEKNSLRDYEGLSRSYSPLAAFLAFFMVSLAGFPPTAGFLAKFFLFAEVGKAGLWPLVVIAVITTLASVYYYLRVVLVMYMKEGMPTASYLPSGILTMFISTFFVLELGIFPSTLLVFLKYFVG